jgi:hypothetical protein
MMDNLIILNFAEAKQPEYRERRGHGYIEFGEKNDYPDYLLSLYNKSAKHNAIVRGKVNYITGNGWATKQEDAKAQEFIDNPNQYESLTDLTRKVSIDLEVFGGAYLEIIWSKLGGTIASMTHIDYTKIRSNKDNTQFWYKDDWGNRKDKEEIIAAYNLENRQGKQILYLKEYRPGLDTYALPGYIGALNYIESDVEVSRHVLGNAQTGFSASKLITLPNGEPSPDEKRNIERRFTDRFSGSDGKKFILSFVTDINKKPAVEDLGASDLTKEDFNQVDKMIQQNIFAGHQITTPSLFGILTEGSLGARSEIRDGYEVFKNTYVNDKQQFLESVFNQLASINGVTEEIYIKPVEPINFEFSENVIAENMTKDEIREKIGLAPLDTENESSNAQKILDGINSLSPLIATKVLDSMSTDEIRALVGLSQVSPSAVSPDGTPLSDSSPVAESMINEHLKGMKGREWQNFQRIIREYNKGKITREQATQMLKSGYGLDDQAISTWLGDDTYEQRFDDLDSVIAMFDEYGEKAENFSVLATRQVFNQDQEMQMFAEVIDDTLDKKILSVIAKNKNVLPEDIAKAVEEELAVVQERINKLVELDILKFDPKTSTSKLLKPLSEIIDKPIKSTFLIRYAYEWKSEVPVGQRDSRNHPSRAFCQKVMGLDKFWSRAEIEQLSSRLGYSVFDRAGGWWTMPNGIHFPSCRHQWVSKVVVKKSK